MQIYLPIAEMAVPAEQILLVSSFVGFLSGCLGLGGGFMTTPFLLFIGVPPSIAVGTQNSQLVASSFSGVLGHLRSGNVDTKVGLFMLSGGFTGSLLGTFLFQILKHMGQVDFTILSMYILLLGGVGLTMLFEIIQSIFSPKSPMRSEFNNTSVHPLIHRLPFKIRFPRSKLYMSALVPVLIGFIGGVIASLLGIGGGFILVPAMIYFMRMPTILVAGTSLFQMIFTAAFSLMMHATINHTVDIVLGTMLIVGAAIGARFGASVSRLLRGLPARVLMVLVLLSVCLVLCIDVFRQPAELFSTIPMMQAEGAR